MTSDLKLEDVLYLDGPDLYEHPRIEAPTAQEFGHIASSPAIVTESGYIIPPRIVCHGAPWVLPPIVEEVQPI